MLVRSFPVTSGKRLTRDVFDTLPHNPSLLMTSLTQTAGHKMAALTAVFLPLSDVGFEQRGPRIE